MRDEKGGTGEIKMAYCFYDQTCFYPDATIEDICGEDYIELLTTCFQYSKYFSLTYLDRARDIPELDPFLVYSAYTHSWPGTRWTSEIGRFCVYRCTEETFQFLCNYVDSVLSWDAHFEHETPEDLAFYRSDKTLFFESVSHEGVCYLWNRPEENVFSVVSKNEWEFQEEPAPQNFYFY